MQYFRSDRDQPVSMTRQRVFPIGGRMDQGYRVEMTIARLSIRPKV